MKTYCLLEITKMSHQEIQDLKINRIITTSNFDKEMFWEKTVCTCENPYYLRLLAKFMESQNSNESDIYFKAVDVDYELYQWEP